MLARGAAAEILAGDQDAGPLVAGIVEDEVAPLGPLGGEPQVVEEARAEAFRRMAFNVAAANCDDHTKNFSFVLPEGGRWALSPAYDVTHAHAPDSRWTAWVRLALAFLQ